MGAKVSSININGCYLVEPSSFGDDRGSFMESYRREWIPGAREVIQMNCSRKSSGSLAGFHYHMHQSDYWFVPVGTARVNLYDMRLGSPTYDTAFTIDISNNIGVYIPPGVAHGFSALTDVILTYLVDNYYNQADELGVAWNDEHIGANWGFDVPIISNRDNSNPCLKDIPLTDMPKWPLRT